MVCGMIYLNFQREMNEIHECILIIGFESDDIDQRIDGIEYLFGIIDH